VSQYSLKFDHETRGWVDLIPLRKPQPNLTSNLDARWLVIGAGYTGLSCARRLAELNPNEKIVLLDAREVGQSASGRNSGYVVAHSHFSGGYQRDQLGQYERIDRINQAGLESLKSIINKSHIHCDFKESGIYHMAADLSSSLECDYFIDYLEKREIKHTPLAQDQIHLELGTKWYQKGVKVHNGALVQPAQLVFGLADNLPNNVELYENSPVIDMRLGKINTLRTPNSTIRAENVIMACNYEPLVSGQQKQRVVGVTLSGSITRVLTQDEMETLGSETSWGILSLHSGGATVRLTKDKRISIRNTAEYNNHRLLRKGQLKARQKIHRQAFDNRFPELSHVPFEHLYSGVEGVTANKTNIFKRLSSNLYFAGCYNGSGITKGTAFGIAVADLACGHDAELVSDCLGIEKAKWLPPRPFIHLGAWYVTKQRFRGVGKDL
jgi:glycine/D-amino acid oxidase-like deaminating enzyme